MLASPSGCVSSTQKKLTEQESPASLWFKDIRKCHHRCHNTTVDQHSRVTKPYASTETRHHRVIFAVLTPENYRHRAKDDYIGSFLPLLPRSGVESENPTSTAEAESMEEDHPQGIEADDSHQSSPYKDGETLMVMIKDEEKACWAMLVSQEMVDHINFAKQQSRAIEKRESAVDQAATEVLTIEVSIEEAEDEVNQESGQESGQLQKELGILQVKQGQAKDRRDTLQEDIESYQSGFECSKNTTQRMVEDALEEAGLLDPPEPDSPLGSAAEDMNETAQSDQASVPLNERVSMLEATTEEELVRWAACEDLDQSRRAQRDAQTAFDGRKWHYEQELARFNRLTEEGKIDYTRSGFDVEQDVKYVQKLTRNLRDADEWALSAQLNCQALGIRTDPDISYSDYREFMDLAGNRDDGSWTDQDKLSNIRAKREDIEAWTHGVWKNQSPEILEIYDLVSFDEWDSKPDGPMDSISVLDCDRWVVEIGCWREHCAQLRCEESQGPLREDVWAINLGGGYRRRSIQCEKK